MLLLDGKCHSFMNIPSRQAVITVTRISKFNEWKYLKLRKNDVSIPALHSLASTMVSNYIYRSNVPSRSHSEPKAFFFFFVPSSYTSSLLYSSLTPAGLLLVKKKTVVRDLYSPWINLAHQSQLTYRNTFFSSRPKIA